jgi:uncharacterized membrane protein YdfJ with MMPL/SSD domain
VERRRGKAFEDWAVDHRWTATTLGVVTLSAPLIVGLLLAGESVSFALLTAAALAVTVLVVLGVVSLVTGRPVLFGMFGTAPPRDPGLTPWDSGGWFGGGDGGAGGGDGGGGGGGGGGS